MALHRHPPYCGEQWIAAALQSLVANADSGIEVLLVDGSLTSLAREIASTYSDRIQLRIIERKT